jgi:hypothetical protein
MANMLISPVGVKNRSAWFNESPPYMESPVEAIGELSEVLTG